MQYVCDCECRRRHFEQLAGLTDEEVALMYAGHIGTVEISADDLAGARWAEDYRQHLEAIVDAINPQDMPGGPFA